ncbi:MAG: glycosyltransferase [Clostridiales bacterium]|nr:glycosyltransferase [Clostridiales bacterium]
MEIQRNEKRKKVGIVLPSFNQGKYLERAIKSIVENMKHENISLVVMDGGSTDNSIEIIKRYEKYIYYWQSQNDGGQAAAINEGVRHLEDCDYIMWLNSDDEFEDEIAVNKIASFAQKSGYKVCYGKSYFIDEKSQKIGTYNTYPFDCRKIKKECFLSQPSVLVDKRVWEEYDGLDERLKMCLDYELWIRLSKKYEFGYLEEYIGNTRMYENTKTSTMQSVHLDEAICILNKQYGKVSVNWIYSKWLYKHNLEDFRKPIKWIIKFFLMHKKAKYIREAQKNCNYE